jgi:hypothetical protein
VGRRNDSKGHLNFAEIQHLLSKHSEVCLDDRSSLAGYTLQSGVCSSSNADARFEGVDVTRSYSSYIRNDRSPEERHSLVAATMGPPSLVLGYESSVCVSGNATVMKWLLARFDDRRMGFPISVILRRSGSVSQSDKQGNDWSSSYFLDRSFRRKGGTGSLDGGRELNYSARPK